MAIPFGAIVAAALPFVGRYLQVSSAKDKEDAERRSTALDRARAISEEVSGTLNKLLFHAERGMYAAVMERKGKDKEELEEEDKRHWQDFNTNRQEWYEHRIYLAARVVDCFGEEIGSDLVKIEANLDKMHEQIDAARYGDTTNEHFITEDNYKKLFIADLHDPTVKLLNKMSRDMLEAIQNRRVDFMRQSQNRRIGFMRRS